jgi:hypothetical protein
MARALRRRKSVVAYVIASTCIDVKDGACQEARTVDAIYASEDLPESERAFRARERRVLWAGDPERARNIFDAYLPLARYEQQPGLGLAVRKTILAQRGAIASPALRKPSVALSSTDIAEVERLIARQTRRLREIG